MSAPAYCHIAAFDAFKRGLACADTTEGLCEAAVAIARHAYPMESLSDTHARLDELAGTVQRRLRSDSDEARLAHLHDVLFDVAGFRGEEENYYESTNSYLPHVLRTKRGLPITLVLVYRLVADRIGLHVEGVNAPGHFLAAVQCRESVGERTIYVDPFYGGGLLTEDEVFRRLEAALGRPIEPDPALLRRASPTAWLSRMLLNLQAVFAREGSQRDVYAMLELQSLISELSR